VKTEKDVANLVLSGLRSHIKEKLEGFDFLMVGQVLQRALAHESLVNKSKEMHRMIRSWINLVENNSDSDEEADVYTAELVWSAKAKPHMYDNLKLVHKNRDEDIKCSLDASKCEKIFDALLRRRAYCKYHHFYSHATNDCNVFRRQIQLGINEGRLSFAGMDID
jgi:hypothetical protein